MFQLPSHHCDSRYSRPVFRNGIDLSSGSGAGLASRAELFNIIKIFAGTKTTLQTGTAVAEQVQVLATSGGAFQTAVFAQRRQHYLIRYNFLMCALTTLSFNIDLNGAVFTGTYLEIKCVAEISNFPTACKTRYSLR